MRFLFAVDWDGTCVENRYPEMGDWLPGAVEGLHQLVELGKVVIHSCRVAPAEADNETWRDPLEAAAEIAAIRRMLRKRGLDQIEVWTKPWKPSALCYIDDKGFHFDGDWGAAVDFAQSQLEAVMSR